MSNRGWSSEERYFERCPMCGDKFPMIYMIMLKKTDRYNSKKLTRLCNDCYIKVLEFIGIKDCDL